MAVFNKVLILDENEEIVWKHALKVFKTDEAVQEFMLEPNELIECWRPIDIIQTQHGRDNIQNVSIKNN